MPGLFAPIGSLVLGISLIQFPNGYTGTLIGVRVAAENLEPVISGIVMSAYFAGYAAGAVVCRRYRACAQGGVQLTPPGCSPRQSGTSSQDLRSHGNGQQALLDERRLFGGFALERTGAAAP